MACNPRITFSQLSQTAAVLAMFVAFQVAREGTLLSLDLLFVAIVSYTRRMFARPCFVRLWCIALHCFGMSLPLFLCLALYTATWTLYHQTANRTGVFFLKVPFLGQLVVQRDHRKNNSEGEVPYFRHSKMGHDPSLKTAAAR